MQYEIKGTPLPVIICHLNPNESMITESGAMSWMSEDMIMETTSNGGIGKVFGRMFSGETLFLNRYTAGPTGGQIAFTSCFPGSILAFDITEDNPLIVQKSGFLASEPTVQLSTHFQKRFSSGFFGGEGFIMQKLSGHGKAFIEIDGHVEVYDLAPGQKMVIDTGYLAAMEATCQLEIKSIKGVKNMLFGGEGIFNTVVTGPGKIYLQTMPIVNLAGAIIPFIPTSK